MRTTGAQNNRITESQNHSTTAPQNHRTTEQETRRTTARSTPARPTLISAPFRCGALLRIASSSFNHSTVSPRPSAMIRSYFALSSFSRASLLVRSSWGPTSARFQTWFQTWFQTLGNTCLDGSGRVCPGPVLASPDSPCPRRGRAA